MEIKTNVDISRFKINALAALGIFLALGFSYALLRAFEGDGGLVSFGVLSLVLAVLFLALLTLQSILIKDMSRLASVLFLEAVALALPFLFSFSIFLAVGSVAAYLLFLWGSWSAKKELEFSMKIRIMRLSKFILPKAITALSIFVATSYVGVFEGNNLVISRDTFGKILVPVEGVLQIITPGISLGGSVENFIQNLNSEADAETVEAQKSRIAQLLRFEFDAREAVVNVLYDAYVDAAGRINEGQKVLVLLVLGGILFLLIRTFGAPLYWFVALFAALTYEVLIALGFATVVLETRSKEIVLLE